MKKRKECGNRRKATLITITRKKNETQNWNDEILN
jgi:hypothetical protein